MSHFTYKDTKNMDRDSLCQGDVICLSDELIESLSEIHPYFNNGNYRYFIVITQSCVLVRRNGKPCKSPFITLAAFCSLYDFYIKNLY